MNAGSIQELLNQLLSIDESGFLRLVEYAMAMGFQDKWPDEGSCGG